MNTKQILTIVGILAIVAVIVRAAEPVPKPVKAVEYYKAGEFSVESFYATRTDDFEAETGSAGVGVGYFLTKNFGARFSSSVENLNGPFVDNVTLHGIYRVPIERTAIYGYAGSTFLLRPDEWTIDLGIGVEHRFFEHVGPFIEAGMQKLIDHGAEAVGKVGVRISW